MRLGRVGAVVVYTWLHPMRSSGVLAVPRLPFQVPIDVFGESLWSVMERIGESQARRDTNPWYQTPGAQHPRTNYPF